VTGIETPPRKPAGIVADFTNPGSVLPTTKPATAVAKAVISRSYAAPNLKLTATPTLKCDTSDHGIDEVWGVPITQQQKNMRRYKLTRNRFDIS
jgi:hypothetical protein